MLKFLESFISEQSRFRKAERTAVKHATDIDGMVSLLRNYKPRELHQIYLNQRDWEWKSLMSLLLEHGFPKRIIEIGTGRAGSSYFWTRLAGQEGKVVTVDLIAEPKDYVAVYAEEGGNLSCVTGHSAEAGTINQVRQIMGGEPVDLLYIDGDHSYEGVKRDFETYQQFCNHQTLIAMHDIQSDKLHQAGENTASHSGEVFEYWLEIKDRFDHVEYIEDRAQDGFGLGLLAKPGVYPWVAQAGVAANQPT